MDNSKENDMVLIMDNIYLGNITAANNINNLKKEGIKKILSVIDYSRAPRYKEEDNFNQKIINIADVPVVNIIKYFGECINFIEGEDKVLVHCIGGASRSASIVIAYIMWKLKISYKEAYIYVNKKKSSIFPNSGFQEQLKKFEALLKENKYNLNDINFRAIIWKPKISYTFY